MRIHMAETRRDGVRVALTFVVVAAVAVGTVALLELRPSADRMVDTMKAVETTVPEASGADGVPFAGLEKQDRLTVLRLRHVGKDIPRHWRRRLVRRTAPALAQWIGGMGEWLSAAGTNRIPAVLHDRLALSFKSHELMRVRFIVDLEAITAARDAGYHFERRYAITFGDIIVFGNADAAASEMEWVRQLAHLRLYYHWGPERFATEYLENWRRIEHEVMRISARHAQALTAIYGPGEAGSRGASNGGI